MYFKENRAPRYKIGDKELIPSPGETPPFNFEPQGQMFNDKFKLIADVPGQPDVLLRWTSDRWIKCTSDLIYDVQERIKVSEMHHQQLASLGIKIPAHTHIAIGRAPNQDAVALYTLVERLNVTEWQELASTEMDHLIETKVVDPLERYYDWLESTKQPYQLQDLGIFTQFGLVANPGAGEGYDAYLLDIECLVAPRL